MAGRLRAVLFDFDDTLVDWSGVRLGWRDIESARLTRVVDYVYGETRSYWLDADSLVDSYLQHTREAWSKARSTLRAPHMPSILLSALEALGVAVDRLDDDELLRAYDWNVVPGVVVFPDVPPALKTLSAAGIKLGIVTNASQPMSMRDSELVAHGLIDYFPECRLSAADVGYLKPHARIFSSALRRLRTAPAETVFIGDNPQADIAGASAVGMRAVLRINDAAAANGDLPAQQRSLRTMDELPAILDEWFPGWRYGSA